MPSLLVLALAPLPVPPREISRRSAGPRADTGKALSTVPDANVPLSAGTTPGDAAHGVPDVKEGDDEDEEDEGGETSAIHNWAEGESSRRRMPLGDGTASDDEKEKEPCSASSLPGEPNMAPPPTPTLSSLPGSSTPSPPAAPCEVSLSSFSTSASTSASGSGKWAASALDGVCVQASAVALAAPWARNGVEAAAEDQPWSPSESAPGLPPCREAFEAAICDLRAATMASNSRTLGLGPAGGRATNGGCGEDSESTESGEGGARIVEGTGGEKGSRTDCCAAEAGGDSSNGACGSAARAAV
mmetsp:Transcript_14484/g.37438  ORF Transcript_14484/g.37438 Transcript_14484/m.37438 type:complete len:301 (-) Transcript_14484:581-1483(-)